MLVLQRKQHGGIIICLPDGREVEVRILAIDGGKVRVGLTAPADVRIWREEIKPQTPAESRT